MSVKNYDVGYGKPPVAKQFVKGKSGNPKGRPKKSWKASPSMETMLYKILHRKTTVKINGKSRQMELREALVESLIQQAFAGNIPAYKYVFGLIDRLETNEGKLDWKEIIPAGQLLEPGPWETPMER